MAALIRMGTNARLNRLERFAERMPAGHRYEPPVLIVPELLHCLGWVAWSLVSSLDMLPHALNRYSWLLGRINQSYKLAKPDDRDALEARCNQYTWESLLNEHAKLYGGIGRGSVHEVRGLLASTGLYQDEVPDSVWDHILSLAYGGQHAA